MSRPPDETAQGPRDCGTFLLDLVGSYAPQQVAVRWSEAPRPTCPEVDRLIARTWTDRARRAEHEGWMFYDGALCRLTEWSADDGVLTLTLGAVSYREFLGTNATHAHIRYVHGPEVLADPLGVSAALTTAEGFLVLGRRSRRVMQYAGRIHPVGGLVEPGAEASALPDPFLTMRAELEEELALDPQRVGRMLCIGLVRDKHTDQPELILDVTTDTEVGELRADQAAATDSAEHTGLEPVRDDPASLVNFIEQRYAKLTPVALATLLLHGLHSWGTGWFAAARGYCRNVI
ncbi:MAG: hypothetical protein ACOC8F_00325 [Planctomycetota bacterium]